MTERPNHVSLPSDYGPDEPKLHLIRANDGDICISVGERPAMDAFIAAQSGSLDDVRTSILSGLYAYAQGDVETAAFCLNTAAARMKRDGVRRHSRAVEEVKGVVLKPRKPSAEPSPFMVGKDVVAKEPNPDDIIRGLLRGDRYAAEQMDRLSEVSFYDMKVTSSKDIFKAEEVFEVRLRGRRSEKVEPVKSDPRHMKKRVSPPLHPGHELVEDLDADGNLFTIKDFMDMVKSGGVTSDDGFGCLADITRGIQHVNEGTPRALIEQALNDEHPWTHVNWYNK